ncbi:MAG: hypothetical protein R3F43_21015 [bacterium]
MVDDPYALAARAADWLRAHGPAPRVCAVLGSGLGALAERLTDPVAFSYADIPGFADVSVTGHAGQLVVGGLGDGGPRIAALAVGAPVRGPPDGARRPRHPHHAPLGCRRPDHQRGRRPTFAYRRGSDGHQRSPEPGPGRTR